jgi:hypothetical protein
MFRNLKLTAIVILTAMVSLSLAYADRTHRANDCSFYRNYVQKKFNCANDEYPIGYGEKYCNKFNTLGKSDLSEAGILWRNETLTCLQEALVPTLSENSPIKTCRELDELAFDSHPACYTNINMSICDLSLSDWITIGGVVDAADYLSMKSLKQIASVIKTCGGDILLELKSIDAQLIFLNDKSFEKSTLMLEKNLALLERKAELLEKLEFIEGLKE